MSDCERCFNDEPICPWCDGTISDAFEFPDEVEEYKCDHCGKLFSIQRDYSVTYDTFRVEGKDSQ